jgi:hypothetical protein
VGDDEQGGVMDALHEETAAAFEQAADKALSDETVGKLKQKARDIFQDALDDIEWNLKQDLAHNLAAYTAEMAHKTVDALLAGNEDEMRRYLSCEAGRWNGRSGDHNYYKQDIARQHSVIHGRLFETGIELRAKIVAAHRDLITSERVLDLEDQVKSLVAQVNKLDAEKQQLIQRLNDTYRGDAA